jgi:hypothetical protein
VPGLPAYTLTAIRANPFVVLIRPAGPVGCSSQLWAGCPVDPPLCGSRAKADCVA